MSGSTQHFGLHKMTSGDGFSEEGYKHLWADRDLIDLLMYIGAISHQHTGQGGVEFAPEFGPSLSTNPDVLGSIPAGRRVYYKITYLNDEGIESAASPESFMDTPAAVQAPAPPTLVVDASGGTLTAGTYFYILSAYVGSSTEETRALSPNSVRLSGTTNAVDITLPSLPSGADGFNLYRRGPGDLAYRFVATVDSTHLGSPYVDDASVVPSTTRSIPQANTTNASNALIVGLPGATPVLPDGVVSWKIYRTTVNGDWANSTLTWVDTGAVSYTDLGFATTTGQYPSRTLIVTDPSKIDLTDGSEVQGVMPLSHASAPLVKEFFFSGQVTTGQKSQVWWPVHPNITPVAVVVNLGKGRTPASTPVKVDIKYATANPPVTWVDSIFDSPTNVPAIAVGQNVALSTSMAGGAYGSLVYSTGTFSFVVDVLQAGGGATPTDYDLTVQLYYVATDFTSEDSFSPGTFGELP